MNKKMRTTSELVPENTPEPVPESVPEITPETVSETLPEDLEFNLSDFALFLSVMKKKEAHENILSIIMDKPDLELTEIHVEEVILNRCGQRAIRLDAWAVDSENRYYATEMQNDTERDDVRRRSRFYQGLLDTPLLKSGKETRYKHLPSTIVTFITQKDIFKGDRAKYTFTEQCEEIAGLRLEDGTTKIFLNMSSKNGDPVLVSLLQYMKHSHLDNPDILVEDERILELDEVVQEVKQSEEWEAAKMSILSVGIERGREIGLAEGHKSGLEEGLARAELTKKVFQLSISGKSVEAIAKELNISIDEVNRILE